MKIRAINRQHFANFVKSHYILIVILLVATAVRLYKLKYMVNYDFDQEYATNFVLDVVREYPIRYVGQGLSIQGLFMGPWYFYFLVPWYLLTGLNPIGGFIGSALLGVLIVFAYYWVTKTVFNKKAGLIAAALRAVGFYAISADWSMVPSYSSDLAVLLTWYCFFQIYHHKTKYLYLLGLIFGLFTSFHVIQFPFYLVFVALLLFWKIRVPKKIMIGSLGMFILPNLPLLLFEYWRNWAMSKQILNMLLQDSGRNWTETILKLKTLAWVALDYFGVLAQLTGHKLLIILVFVMTLILLGFVIKTHKKFHYPALASSFIIFLVYYAVLPTNVPEYYLRALQVIMLMYFAYLLSALQKNWFAKYLVALFLIYYTAMNIRVLSYFWNNTKTSFGNKESIVQEVIRQVGNDNFALSYVVQPGWGSGFDSLFRLANKTSTGQGKVYTIVSPINKIKPGEIGFVRGDIGIIYPKE